jgi:topoisomerase-4 subunit A
VLLLNGASGIAVGMATEIPSHNLVEVSRAAIALIRDPGLGVAGLMEHIQGPDFPGGAQIITPREEMIAAYESGRGSIRTRARWSIERLARGQWQLVVTELPPGTSSRKVLEEIDALTNPQNKPGKKSLTPEQQREKQLMLSMLDKARDESDRTHPVRLVFEPKTSRIDETEFVNLLLAKTSLEGNVSINMVMVGLDGRPTGKSLLTFMREWVEFRLETVRRRSRFRLDQVLDRIHVLEGRQLVLLNIDEVIRIIRNADEPKPALIERFALSERQAEDILEIRLRQLARLEAIKIEQELSQLRDERQKLEDILASPAALKRTVIREIEADAKAFGDDRRTLVQEERKAVAEVRIVDEPVTVVVSAKGWVRALKGHEVDPAALQFKPGDTLLSAQACRSVDTLAVLGSNGRSYSVAVAQLPGGRGDGAPITTFIDLEPGTQPAHYLAGGADTTLLLANSGGFGLLARTADLYARNKGGKAFLTLEAGEQVLPPVAVQAAHRQVAGLAADGRLLVFPLDELKLQPNGGKGLTLMDVDAKTPLLSVCTLAETLRVTGQGRGGKPKDEDFRPAALAAYQGKRARKGRKVEGFPKPMRVVAL